MNANEFIHRIEADVTRIEDEGSACAVYLHEQDGEGYRHQYKVKAIQAGYANELVWVTTEQGQPQFHRLSDCPVRVQTTRNGGELRPTFGYVEEST